jgi:GNAT superfamily N-acetyltransferase
VKQLAEVINVRLWQPEDEHILKSMIRACLEETSRDGFILAPTPENVERLWKMGLEWSQRGEPTFVAEVGPYGVIAGYILWGESAPPGWFTKRVCYGWGTFVAHRWRRSGVANKLRAKALETAKERGYDCVVGTAFSEAGLSSALHDGFKIIGHHVEYRL